MGEERYAEVFSFLKLHTSTIELADPESSARVLIAPELAGRVMTSTPEGMKGQSIGWINRKAFVGPKDPHFNNYGGEERLWLGPEGGQFSLYFQKGKPFTIENWYVPRAFNDEAYAVVDAGETEVTMVKSMALQNYSGTSFELLVERKCRLIPKTQAAAELNLSIPESVKIVAYETENTLINKGKQPFKKEKGLVSVWLLGMFNSSNKTSVLIPFRSDEEGGSGPIVNDRYFGPVPEDRLVLKGSVVVFRADGMYRSKIGLGPKRCTGRAGSLDLENSLFTLITFTFSEDQSYVNSLWEIQEDPYKGDVVNSYNDGPLPGSEEGLGGFYELESSSPAKELQAGERLTHIQKTFHMRGPLEELDKISKKILRAGINESKSVLKD